MYTCLGRYSRIYAQALLQYYSTTFSRHVAAIHVRQNVYINRRPSQFRSVNPAYKHQDIGIVIDVKYCTRLVDCRFPTVSLYKNQLRLKTLGYPCRKQGKPFVRETMPIPYFGLVIY